MAGPADNRGLDHGFDHPPEERSRKVDVLGNAERLIIPALRDLLIIETQTTTGDNWEQAEREKARRYALTARERLAAPIWGDLDILDAPRKMVPRPIFVGKDIRGKNILPRSQDASLQGCVVISTGPILQESSGPRIKDSLLVGGLVLYGDNNNNSPFNPEQLLLMAKLGEAIQETREDDVASILLELDKQAERYDKNIYKPREDEIDAYQKRYGELATIASVVDKRYLHLLKGGETTDVAVDNSILVGQSARVLGGVIRNPVLAATHNVFANAHVEIENSFFVTGTHNLHVEHIEKGKFGSPQQARAAVEAVKNLPEKPLLNL